MQITRSGKTVFIGQWIAAVILPVFIFIGRGLVGAELGWMAVVGFVYGALIIVLLLVPAVLTLFDSSTRRSAATRSGYTVVTFVLWAALIIAGLSIPDAGDSGPLRSALTVWTNGAIGADASEAVFASMLGIAVIAWLSALALAIVGIVRAHRER